MDINNPYILKLISNYISKDINKKEFNELKKWMNKSPKNKQFFIDHLLIYKKARKIQFTKILDKDIAWDTISSKLSNPLQDISFIEKPPSKIKNLKSTSYVLKYASSLIIFLTVGYMYLSGYLYKKEEIIIPAESIILELENGEIQIIKEDNSSQLIDAKGNVVGKQNGTQLEYNNDLKKETLVYNTLTIPYGKRFIIKLSDGTVVNLNAGSSLKYPVKFLEGEKNREVFLNGEAFFSVAKNLEHPFIVNAENLNIEVIGTEFNISAYPEDLNTDVVLVKGALGIYKTKQTIKEGTLLVPNTKGSFNKKNSNISTEKVNPSIYTSWTQGNLFFRGMPFKNIIKKMERHYNIKINLLNKQLENEVFNANFREEPLEKILSYFNDSYSIEYKIENNIVYIK